MIIGKATVKTILERLERDLEVSQGGQKPATKSAVVLSHEEATIVRNVLREHRERERREAAAKALAPADAEEKPHLVETGVEHWT